LLRAMDTLKRVRRITKKRLSHFLVGALGLLSGNATLKRLRPSRELDGHTILVVPEQSGQWVDLTSAPGSKNSRTRIGSPAIHALEASHICFETNSEILEQRGRLFRQPLSGTSRRGGNKENLFGSSWLIHWNSTNMAVARNHPPQGEFERIDSGILVSGQAHMNWYHWAINILPKAFVAEHQLGLSPEIPFLLPQGIRGTRLEELFQLAIGSPRRIRYLEDRPYYVEHAIVLESPVRENYRPKNVFAPIDWSQTGSFHFEIMSRYRSKLIERASAHKSSLDLTNLPERVFLTRDNHSRPYNQDEIGELLAETGFVSIDPSRLGAADQIRLFSSCKLIVGSTGAQWAGWLFTNRATGLILIPRFLGGSSLFTKLGVLGESRLFEHIIQSSHNGWTDYHSSAKPSWVDPRGLAKALSLLDF
jgi:hypothetical protein